MPNYQRTTQGDGQTLVLWPMYQLKHKGSPTFEIFEIAFAKLPEDDPATLGVVPDPMVMGRPWYDVISPLALSHLNTL